MRHIRVVFIRRASLLTSYSFREASEHSRGTHFKSIVSIIPLDLLNSHNYGLMEENLL